MIAVAISIIDRRHSIQSTAILLLLLLLLFKTLQCTYVYLYHTYKPLQ